MGNSSITWYSHSQYKTIWRKKTIKFNNNPLVATTKFVNAYIVHDLDNQPKNSTVQLYIKKISCLAQLILEKNDKIKYGYSSCGIAFDKLSSWRFGNNFARNVIIISVDNSSSSHTDNRKNDVLVLGEGTSNEINGSISASEQIFSINFSIAKTKFCTNQHYNCGNNYLFVNR